MLRWASVSQARSSAAMRGGARVDRVAEEVERRLGAQDTGPGTRAGAARTSACAVRGARFALQRRQHAARRLQGGRSRLADGAAARCRDTAPGRPRPLPRRARRDRGVRPRASSARPGARSECRRRRAGQAQRCPGEDVDAHCRRRSSRRSWPPPHWPARRARRAPARSPSGLGGCSTTKRRVTPSAASSVAARKRLRLRLGEVGEAAHQPLVQPRHEGLAHRKRQVGDRRHRCSRRAAAPHRRRAGARAPRRGRCAQSRRPIQRWNAVETDPRAEASRRRWASFCALTSLTKTQTRTWSCGRSSVTLMCRRRRKRGRRPPPGTVAGARRCRDERSAVRRPGCAAPHSPAMAGRGRPCPARSPPTAASADGAARHWFRRRDRCRTFRARHARCRPASSPAGSRTG